MVRQYPALVLGDPSTATSYQAEKRALEDCVGKNVHTQALHLDNVRCSLRSFPSLLVGELEDPWKKALEEMEAVPEGTRILQLVPRSNVQLDDGRVN